jgi:hypothetical protein
MNKQAHLKTILSILGLATYIYLVVKYPIIFWSAAIPVGFACLYVSLYNIFKS